MIVAYFSEDKLYSQTIGVNNQSFLQQAIWVDLLCPSKEEKEWIKQWLHVVIPDREEMQGIEPSSRLYKENGIIFMTATMIAKSDSDEPKSDAITLILKEKTLITVRYIEPQAFDLFILSLPKLRMDTPHPWYLMITLLEIAIDRLADISERIGQCLDSYSQTIFRTQTSDTIKLDYKKLLQELGSNGDLNTKAWESLVSFNRLNSFFGQMVVLKIDDDLQLRLSTLTKDISALSDQVKFLTAKVTFLLDATLGMVNIEQNNIIKIFSIAAVIFLPPTLIASIYGMNFNSMPELRWSLGYPISLLLMLFAAWLPYKYFKLKKWL